MEAQTLILGSIVLGAAVYVTSIFWAKVRSFAPDKPGCGGDCGCSRDGKK